MSVVGCTLLKEMNSLLSAMLMVLESTVLPSFETDAI